MTVTFQELLDFYKEEVARPTVEPGSAVFDQLVVMLEEYHLYLYFNQPQIPVYQSPQFFTLAEIGFAAFLRRPLLPSEVSDLKSLYLAPSTLFELINHYERGYRFAVVGNLMTSFAVHASHFLPYYNGKCRRLHGHEWRFTVGVTAYDFDKQGFVLDFKELKRDLAFIHDRLDHRLMNIFFPNPTVELIHTLTAYALFRLDRSWKPAFLEICETQTNCYQMKLLA